VAQLGARFHGMEEVTGSIPVRSTNQSSSLANRQEKRDALVLELHLPQCFLRNSANHPKEDRPMFCYS
jgi:hypothetical protein